MTVENGELITVGEEEYVQMPRSKLVAFKLKLDTMRPYGRIMPNFKKKKILYKIKNINIYIESNKRCV